ncbi:MAG TPA: hypothetical protein VFE12_02600, partial [Acetobacteraceae bacterium]|nr:hypothetical protein [Acetobacteraceae bacterium]
DHATEPRRNLGLDSLRAAHQDGAKLTVTGLAGRDRFGETSADGAEADQANTQLGRSDRFGVRHGGRFLS